MVKQILTSVIDTYLKYIISVGNNSKFPEENMLIIMLSFVEKSIKRILDDRQSRINVEIYNR